MRYLLFWLEALTFLLAVALVLSAPVLVVLVLLRHRLNALVAKVLLSASFAAAVALQIWRMEWFDVWRHGFPGVSYLLTAFVPYVLSFGLLGWWVGGRICRGESSPT